MNHISDGIRIIVSLMILLTLAFIPSLSQAQSDGDEIPDVIEYQIAAKFSPVLHKHPMDLQANLANVEEFFDETSFRTQYETMDKTFTGWWNYYPYPYPWYGFYDGETFVHNTYNIRDNDTCPNGVAINSPNTAVFLLDIPDWARHTGADVGHRPLYYHVRKDNDYYYVQYWYYMLCNDLRNQGTHPTFHEGDWEHVEIRLIEDGFEFEPDRVSFFQHHGGKTFIPQQCWWGPSESPSPPVQMGYDDDNTHLHVWLARNAHASYNRWEEQSYTEVFSPHWSYYVDETDFGTWCPTYFEYDYLDNLGEVLIHTGQTFHGVEYIAHYEPATEDCKEFLSFVHWFGYDFVKIQAVWTVASFEPPRGPAYHFSWNNFQNQLWGHFGAWEDFQGWTGDDPNDNTENHLRGDMYGEISLDSNIEYYLSESLTIHDGGHLIIPAGTTILSTAETNTSPKIIVEAGGKLTAVGTTGDPIVFGSDDDVIHDGASIIIRSGSDPETEIVYCEFSNAPREGIFISAELNEPISDCTFTNCQVGILVDESALPEGESVQIDDCTFVVDDPNGFNVYHMSDGYPVGIMVNGDYQPGVPDYNVVDITNSSFSGLFRGVSVYSTTAGISSCMFGLVQISYSLDHMTAGVYGLGSGIEVTDSWIQDAYSGIFLHSDEVCDISSNSVSGAHWGIYLEDSGGYVYNNSLEDCHIGLKFVNSAPFVHGTYSECKIDMHAWFSSPIMRHHNGSPGLNHFATSGAYNAWSWSLVGPEFPDINHGYNTLAYNDYLRSVVHDYTLPYLPVPYEYETMDMGNNDWGGDRSLNPYEQNNIARFGLIKTDLYDMLAEYGAEEIGQVYEDEIAQYDLDVDNYFGDVDYYSSLYEGQDDCNSCHTHEPIWVSPDHFQAKLQQGIDNHGIIGTFPTPYHQDFYTISGAGRSQNPELAATGYQSIITGSSDQQLQLSALQQLYLVDARDNDNSSASWLSSFVSSCSNPVVKRKAQFIKAQVDALDGSYTSAIQFCEDVIGDPSTAFDDSARAVLTAGSVYIKAALALPSSLGDQDLQTSLGQLSSFGSMANLKPNSLSDYYTNQETLMAHYGFEESISSYSVTEISDSVTWSDPVIHLQEDLLITSTGTLNILPGTIVLGDSVEIRVEGKLIANGDSDSPISFSSFSPSVIGVDLIIAPNSSQESVIKHCRFKNSDKAINVGRSLFQKISNCEFRECNYGVWSVSQPGYVVRLDSCLFVNRDFDSEGVHLYSSRNYSSINECMFIGSMKPIYAINGILKVSNCFFENTAGYLAEEDVAAIAYIMMEGPIERNTIYSYPIGIALYDSDASLISNKIEDSLNEGIWLMSASYPDMTNAGAGAYNWLKGNGIEDLIPTQVLISGNVYPHLDGGLNNIWQATNGFAFISSTPSTVTVTMASNYWGTTNPLVDDLFNPSSSNLSIDNYLAVEQIPAEGYQTRSVMTDLYNSALLAISQDDIASALDMLQTIASTDGEEGIRIGSMSLMNAYWLEDGRDPQLLLDNHLAIADTTMSLKVQLEALRCHAYANAMMGNYTEALDYYEQRLEDPTISSVDSLCTLIDIENITLMSIGEYDLMSIQQGDGPRLLTKDMSTSISENWAEVPEAEYHQYLTKTEQLIKELRGSSHSDSPDQVVELPKEYYLYQNYPNPFNPSTHITFDLVHGGEVTLRVFNVLGQQVLQPLQSRMDAGKHTISVDMQNQSSGIYFYTLSTEKFHETKKMVLLR